MGASERIRAMEIKMRVKTLLAAAAAMTLVAGASHASLITSDATYTGPDLNLAGFDNGSYNFTFGPIAVSGFTFTASPGGSGGFPFGGNSGHGSVVGQGSYGLGANGSFGGSAVYIGVDSGTGFDTLLGTTAYSQLGFFFNYAPGVGDNATISALDASGAVIDTYDLTALAPISTPGAFNAFEFRGIVHSSADIYGLQFGGNYLLASGTATGVVVTPTGAPEPAAWALMILGFGGAGVAMRRRRAALMA